MTKARKSHRHWTEGETEFLKTNYLNLTHKQLIERLNRSLPSILWKARQLGLIKYERKRVYWTDEEIRTLQTEYGYRKSSISTLAKRLEKPISSLNKKAFRLGLTKRLNENAVCPQCKKAFIVRYANQTFCSQLCRNRYKWDLVRKEWGRSGHLSAFSERVIQSEKMVAETILPHHGFTDVVYANEHSGNFIFDILAMKEGQKCAIQVTMYPSWTLKRDFIPILKFLQLRLFCCHVKPDLTSHVLNEINLENHRSSSARVLSGIGQHECNKPEEQMKIISSLLT